VVRENPGRIHNPCSHPRQSRQAAGGEACRQRMRAGAGGAEKMKSIPSQVAGKRAAGIQRQQKRQKPAQVHVQKRRRR